MATEMAWVALIVGKGDVLVAISFPRYSRDTVHLARFARERGAQVMAIVDSHAAPLANEADLRLFKAVALATELTESIASQLTIR